MLAQLEAQPVLKKMIIYTQKNDEELQKKLQMVRDGDKTEFSVKEAGSMYFQNRLCVLDDKEIKKKLLFRLIIRYLPCILEVIRCTRT